MFIIGTYFLPKVTMRVFLLQLALFLLVWKTEASSPDIQLPQARMLEEPPHQDTRRERQNSRLPSLSTLIANTGLLNGTKGNPPLQQVRKTGWRKRSPISVLSGRIASIVTGARSGSVKERKGRNHGQAKEHAEDQEQPVGSSNDKTHKPPRLETQRHNATSANTPRPHAVRAQLPARSVHQIIPPQGNSWRPLVSGPRTGGQSTNSAELAEGHLPAATPGVVRGSLSPGNLQTHSQAQQYLLQKRQQHGLNQQEHQQQNRQKPGDQARQSVSTVGPVPGLASIQTPDGSYLRPMRMGASHSTPGGALLSKPGVVGILHNPLRSTGSGQGSSHTHLRPQQQLFLQRQLTQNDHPRRQQQQQWQPQRLQHPREPHQNPAQDAALPVSQYINWQHPDLLKSLQDTPASPGTSLLSALPTSATSETAPSSLSGILLDKIPAAVTPGQDTSELVKALTQYYLVR